MQTKKCKCCGKNFDQYKTTQKVCSYECAIKYAKDNRRQKEKKEWAKRKKDLKEKLETISQLAVRVQKVFNTYIRLRDKGNKCISCDTPHQSTFQAGHYYSSGGHWNVRFDEDNCFSQCIKCNMYLSGNLKEYRERLLIKIGKERLEELDSRSKLKAKYSKEDLYKIMEKYKKKIKEEKNKKS